MSRGRCFAGPIALITAIAAFMIFTGPAFAQDGGTQADSQTAERNGEFSCRASVARIQGADGAAVLEPITAGAGEADGDPPQPSSPCVSEEAGGPAYEGPVGCEVPPDPDCILDPNGPGGFNPNSFLPNANSIGLLYAKTEQTPEDLNSAPPSTDDRAHSRAGVANIFLTSGGAEDEPQPQSLHISAANSFATVKCVPDDDGTGLEPQLDSRSQAAYARLATNPLDVIPGILPPGATGPDEGGADPPAEGTNNHDHFDLGDARVHFNHVHRDTFVDAEGDTHQRITQQAVVLQQDHTADPNDPEFDPNANQSAIVLAEAVADFEGNPCEQVVVEEEGRITIVKDTEPNDPQDFRFTGNVEDFDQEFELDDDGVEGPLVQETDADEQQPSRASFDRPPGDDYVVTEEEVEGFELEDIECEDPSGDTEEDEDARTARIHLAAGEEVVCTFKNVRQAQVTVVKDTEPEPDPQDFEFELECEDEDNEENDNDENELCEEEFQLDDDGNDGAGNGTDADDNDLPDRRTFTVPASEIEIEETKVAGYTTTVACDPPQEEEVKDEDGKVEVEFDIEPGEHVTCTFTNTKEQQQGRITVVKESDPQDPQDFRFTGVEDGDGQFELDDDGVEGPLQPETDADEQQPSRASFDRAPGQYPLTEGEVNGWELEDIDCDDENSVEDEENRTATINVEDGEHVTCTFKNVRDEQQGRIVIVKDTEPEDPQDFTFNGNVDDDGTFQLDDDGDNDGAGPETAGDDDLPNSAAFDRPPGQFNLTEEEVEGFELEDIDCDDENSVEDEDTRSVVINLEDDETVTCTFLNEAVEEEPEDGRVTVVKNTDPDDPQDFAFEIDRTQGQGSFQEEFVLDDDNDPAHPNQMTFTPGTGRVRIEEEGEDDDGFDLASIDCEPDQGEEVDIDEDGDGGRVEFDLAAGEDVTCTFRNVPADEDEEPEPEEPAPGQGTIEIRKDVVDADKDESPVFHFTGDLGEFDLSENDESGVPDRREFTVDAGEYEVTEEEDGEDGFELFRIRCQGDEDGDTPEQQGPIFGTGNTATINLDPGEDIRCRFINTTDGNDPGNEGPGNADPEDDDNSGSGNGGGGGNSGRGRLASRAF